jgi:hypothetical protein
MKDFFEKYHSAAAVSLVLLFVVVMVSALFFSWGMIEARQSEVEARQTQLEVLKRRAAMPPPAHQAEARKVEPFFGDSFALAANDLQKRIVGMIENAGGTLNTVSVDPAIVADDDTGRKVVVQAVAELSNDSLQELLYQLEAQAPFVFIENLSVNRVSARGGETEDTTHSPKLSVDLRAAGYFKRAAP